MRTGHGLSVWTLYQIGPAIGFCSPCQPAISSGLCRSLNTFAANASRFSWTLIVRSTMSSSPKAVSSRWSRVYADGSVIEMATIGREGCTGMQAFFGAKSSSVRLLVQIPGSAAKMSRVAFARAMESMPSFRHLMSAYIHAFLEQVLVSVACNGAHSLKEKLARWLLMMRDRSDDDALAITQSLLAEMLGVQRPTITHAVRELERAGAIEHGRRQVRIADRQRLIEESCECYQLVRARVAFHLPKTYT
jgi:CRP-like cAMP-binding protein